MEIASSTNACGIGLRCLGSKLASRGSGETCFLLVIPVHLQPRPHNGWESTPKNSTQNKRALLQSRVLRFGLFQDGDVGVGGSAECEPTSDCRYPLAASQEPARSGLHRCQQ